MKTVIIFTFLIHFLLSQGIKFQVQPLPTNITLSQASAQACYANCKSCQTLSNQCQQCYDPYFVKALDGSCQLDQGYTLQSSNNQILSGNAFIYAPESWGNIKNTDCSPAAQYLNAPLRILGPFNAGTNVVYQRSISFHQYIVLSFGLIKMGWDNTSELTITISDDNDNIISSQSIKNTPTIAYQILCSSSKIDQRFSVRFKIADISVTTIKTTFSFSGAGSWGVATWALITGSCDSSCSNCSYSREPTQCIGCNSFFIFGSNSRCSQCFTGFKLVNQDSGIQSCQKCPIQYQNCNPGQQVCYYNNLASQLNANNCTFASSSDYSSTYDVNGLQFPGSLFTVASKPATYQCDSYSLVGLAQVGDGITRIFAVMQLHYLISITFNIFIVDQTQATQNNLFVIILDNIILEASYVVTQGVSNLCGNPQLEAFVTYPATKFYPHNKTSNVNLTITSNAVNWGIRNLRLSFQICDQTCLQCGLQGCLKCQGYFTLNNLKCNSCPLGYGKLTTNISNTCVQCPQNCLTCSAALSSNITKTICLQCTPPFFLFQQQCVKRTNIADTINIPQLSSSNGNGSSWNIKSSPIVSNNSCSINLPLRNNGSSVNFTVSQNLLTSVIKINQPHYRKIVQFYLIKIDDWKSTDLLLLYLNDLLVLQKNYSQFGNNICFNSSQNDFISFQSLQIEDSNSSLSISFEVVADVGAVRRFGVSNFQVFPKGCQNCNEYPFSYKFDYNYDYSLNLHLQFNRLYVNNNQSLFQEIFWMFINGNRVDYSVIWNNSIIYKLQSFPNSEVLNGNLTVICKFPELVQTDTGNSISEGPFFTTRLLQSSSYQNLKVIDNDFSYKKLERYSPPQNAGSINGMRIFFEVISRAVIYLGFAFFFFGCQTSCTHFMHNLQKIWLHIFVAALAAPSALRYALIGFGETQGQNIAIHPSSWQSALPVQLYYNTPSYFEQYYTDIGFFRNIYNIAIAFLILIIFSFVANLVLGRCNFSRNFKDSILWRHLRVTFVKRPFFVFNSIVFYQYLSLVLACTLQFTGFMNKTNKGVFGGVNAAGAVVAFILATIYPLFQFYYMQKKRNSMAQARIQYANRYGQVYYRFLPKDVWVDESIGITYAQQIYNLYRFGQIWWMCIIATLLYQSPQAQCFLLLITNLIHLVMILFTSLSNTLYFKLGKVFQLAFFAGLQILILVCQSQQDSLTSRGFNTLGSVGIALIFAIVFLSAIRSIYTFSKIYDEYCDQNVRIRNQDYFSTKGEQPIPSQRDN